MNTEVFKDISRIIERDSKVSTYKFALLRGTIDIIQENSPYIKEVNGRMHIPLGLLIEKWLVYYYPLLASKVIIPQNYGTVNLAFEVPFRNLISFYKNQNSLSVFYNDLRQGTIPEAVAPVLRELVQSLKNTIAKMPMKYIGNSVHGSHYSVYQLEQAGQRLPTNGFNRNHIIEHSGWFSIPIEYYEAFRLIGSFVGGQDSILFKWAEFSTGADRSLQMETVLDRILESPITERDSEESRKLYRRILSTEGTVKCVWTGRNVTDYHVDHIIPFSIWRNNDLWNLLPSSSRVNGQKSNKIPTPQQVAASGERIISYWNTIEKAQPQRFHREMQVSLLGERAASEWRSLALTQLQDRCAYLIENRGFEAWSI